MARIYFASIESRPKNEQEVLQKRIGLKNVLISYYSMSEKHLELLDKFENVFLDSGAFSAYTQNEEIDLDEYIKFVKKYEDKLERYATLDVIGDPEGTLENTRNMQDEGLSPLPTFHVGSDFKYLKEIVETEPEYIALGGMVPHAKDKAKLNQWIRRCFQQIPDNIKVHGYGLTSQDLVRNHPWASVDSTSWLSGARYGRMYYYQRGELQSFGPNEFKEKFGKAFNEMDYKKMDVWNLKQWRKFANEV